jgi:hypothetical protein
MVRKNTEEQEQEAAQPDPKHGHTHTTIDALTAPCRGIKRPSSVPKQSERQGKE